MSKQSNSLMKCPVCRATYRSKRESSASSQPVNDLAASKLEGISAQATCQCHRCGADLTKLVHIYDQAVKHYQEAIASFHRGEHAQAKLQNQQAIALNQDLADFHAFAGQLLAMEGEFSKAISAWQQAVRLEPDHKLAQNCLHLLHQLTQKLK